MAMLKLRCRKCQKTMDTGFDITLDTYRSATLTQHTIECPHCEHVQTWTFDDVEKSSVPTR
jgi:DNA-directed RNA polymerase subunit RPC12/RpoP